MIFRVCSLFLQRRRKWPGYDVSHEGDRGRGDFDRHHLRAFGNCTDPRLLAATTEVNVLSMRAGDVFLTLFLIFDWLLVRLLPKSNFLCHPIDLASTERTLYLRTDHKHHPPLPPSGRASCTYYPIYRAYQPTSYTPLSWLCQNLPNLNRELDRVILNHEGRSLPPSHPTLLLPLALFVPPGIERAGVLRL